MPRILITGSADGLGLLVAQRLVSRSHNVIIHARNSQRASDALALCPGASDVVTGDLSSLPSTKSLADSINALGPIDTLILNAGLYHGAFRACKETSNIPAVLAVNTVSPYVLAALISPRPKRIVFLSSSMHRGGDASLRDFLWLERGEGAWDEHSAYSDTKLHNVLLAKGLARRWKGTSVNALDPGWMPTKMGGKSAPGDLEESVKSYVLLAEGLEGEEVGEVTGKYWGPGGKEGSALKVCEEEERQEELLRRLGEFTGVRLE